MVHALEIAHGLLGENGRLLDIHPLGEPPPIQVRLGKQIHHAGWLREEDDYIEYEQANNAINKVIEQGLFALEREGTFSFTAYADSLTDFQSYLENEWKDAILEELVARRIEELMHSLERAPEIIMQELIRVNRLRPLP